MPDAMIFEPPKDRPVQADPYWTQLRCLQHAREAVPPRFRKARSGPDPGACYAGSLKILAPPPFVLIVSHMSQNMGVHTASAALDHLYGFVSLRNRVTPWAVHVSDPDGIFKRRDAAALFR